MENDENLCPCCSGKEYDICCKLFHQGAIPENAVLLMRSRSSAYALNIPEYVIETTHPASPQYSDNKFSWRRSISQFARHSSFQNLEILDFKERGTLAVVTFTAYLSQQGHDVAFTEKSYFEKSHNRWFYRAGQLAQGHVPNLITTGQFRLLPLAYYGDPILRRKADEIPDITSSIRKLIEEMIETMDACDGIGLAAPQIHHSIRLFVIREPIQIDEKKFEPGDVKVFINANLSFHSAESWKASEGCISIPTLHALVERPKKVTVEYTTIEGTRVREEVSGWQARVIMHEYDHIDGILFIDRIDSEELSKLMPFLQNLEKRIHDGKAL
jgi:peptide deformylase